jgi:Uma2 family endonuclease
MLRESGAFFDFKEVTACRVKVEIISFDKISYTMSFEINEPAVKYNHFDSVEDFFTYVEPIQAKYELWDGELVLMAGSTKGHALIRDNINDSLKNTLKERGCMSFQESVYLKLRNKDKTLFLPDVIATCHTDDLDLKSRYIESPSIIVEILSESTERFDRGEKWINYRKIPSLRYYILVSQEQPLVEVYGRPHAQSLFLFESFEGLDAVVDLREMDIQIPMQEIYEGIVFETPEYPAE